MWQSLKGKATEVIQNVTQDPYAKYEEALRRLKSENKALRQSQKQLEDALQTIQVLTLQLQSLRVAQNQSDASISDLTQDQAPLKRKEEVRQLQLAVTVQQEITCEWHQGRQEQQIDLMKETVAQLSAQLEERQEQLMAKETALRRAEQQLAEYKTLLDAKSQMCLLLSKSREEVEAQWQAKLSQARSSHQRQLKKQGEVETQLRKERELMEEQRTLLFTKLEKAKRESSQLFLEVSAAKEAQKNNETEALAQLKEQVSALKNRLDQARTAASVLQLEKGQLASRLADQLKRRRESEEQEQAYLGSLQESLRKNQQFLSSQKRKHKLEKQQLQGAVGKLSRELAQTRSRLGEQEGKLKQWERREKDASLVQKGVVKQMIRNLLQAKSRERQAQILSTLGIVLDSGEDRTVQRPLDLNALMERLYRFFKEGN